MVSNGFNKLEAYFSLMWKLVASLCRVIKGPGFSLLFLYHLSGVALIFATKMARSPTHIPASRKRERREDTPLPLRGLTQKLQYITLAHIPSART